MGHYDEQREEYEADPAKWHAKHQQKIAEIRSTSTRRANALATFNSESGILLEYLIEKIVNSDPWAISQNPNQTRQTALMALSIIKQLRKDFS